MRRSSQDTLGFRVGQGEDESWEGPRGEVSDILGLWKVTEVRLWYWRGWTERCHRRSRLYYSAPGRTGSGKRDRRGERDHLDVSSREGTDGVQQRFNNGRTTSGTGEIFCDMRWGLKGKEERKEKRRCGV